MGLKNILYSSVLAAILGAGANGQNLPPAHKVLPYLADNRTVLDITNHTAKDLETTLCYAPSNMIASGYAPYQTPSCMRLRVNAGTSVQLDDLIRTSFGHSTGMGLVIMSNSSSSTLVPTDPVAVPAGSIFQATMLYNATTNGSTGIQWEFDLPPELSITGIKSGKAATDSAKQLDTGTNVSPYDMRALISGTPTSHLKSGELAIATMRVSDTAPGVALPITARNVVGATKTFTNSTITPTTIVARSPSVAVLPFGSPWVYNGTDLNKLELRSTIYAKPDPAGPFATAQQAATLSAILPQSLLSQGSATAFVSPNDTAAYSANIGLFATDEQAIFRVTLKDNRGAVLKTRDITVPSYQMLLQPVNTFFGAIQAADSTLEVQVLQGNRAGAYEQIVDAKSNASMFLLPQPASSAVYLPRVGGSPTDVTLRNNATTANTLTLNLYKTGSSTPAALSTGLQPSQVQTIKNIHAAMQQPAGAQGSLRITGTAPAAISLSRDQYNGSSTLGVRFQGLPTGDTAVGKGTSTDTNAPTSINGIPAATTDVGVVNLSAVPFTGNIYAYDSTGRQIAAYPVGTQAFEPKEYPGLLKSLPGTARVKLVVDNDTLGTTHRVLLYSITKDTNGLVQAVRTGYRVLP